MASTNEVVLDSLGYPIESGWFISGHLEFSGHAGNASLMIPIRGPKGVGTLYVDATKSVGLWTYTAMAVEIDKSKHRINLVTFSPQ